MSDLPAAFRMEADPQQPPSSEADEFAISEGATLKVLQRYRDVAPLVDQLLELQQRALQRASGQQRSEWSEMAEALRRAAVSAHFQQQQHNAELAAMREVIVGELTDREANSARVAERQQVLNDRAEGNDVAFERAVQAAEAIEEMILGLELVCMQKSMECGRLLSMDLTQ